MQMRLLKLFSGQPAIARLRARSALRPCRTAWLPFVCRAFPAVAARPLSSDDGSPSAKRNKAGGRRRVAVYGGAFDPITNSHLTCTSEIVHSGQVDEVWLVPCGKRPDKPKLKTPPLDRFVMCQIAVNTTFSPDFPVKVSDIDVFLDEASFTYDLLSMLRDQNPDIDFSFVIGSDWLQSNTNIASWESKNPNWKSGDPVESKVRVTGDKLLAEFNFVVVPGYVVEQSPEDATGLKKYGPRIQWLSMGDDMTFIEGNLSSTEIRKRTLKAYCVQDSCEQHVLRNIEGLVPFGVLAYIKRANLYSA